LGGWVAALMAWPVAASQDTISQIFFVYILAFLILVSGLTHCIAGSTEFLVSVFAGEATFFEYLGLFLVPTTLGNIIGGLVLVALLNYGQVAGSEKASPAEYMGQDQREGSSRAARLLGVAVDRYAVRIAPRDVWVRVRYTVLNLS
jgi:hypothetical protein